MSVADSETVNEVTPFVGGTSAGAGDPSVHTAVGIVHGLRAVLKWQFERDDFAGMKVAVQGLGAVGWGVRSEEHTSELQSLMRISYAVFCLKKKKQQLKRHRSNDLQML